MSIHTMDVSLWPHRRRSLAEGGEAEVDELHIRRRAGFDPQLKRTRRQLVLFGTHMEPHKSPG